MSHKKLILRELENLLARIEAIKSDNQICDEWIDTDTCSILGGMDSRTFDPLFREYAEILEELNAHEGELSLDLTEVKLGPPVREVEEDEYGEEFIYKLEK